jgi:hypothetical protein
MSDPSSEITLRNKIDEFRAAGRPMDAAHAIAIVVPLAAELADQHRQGYNFFLYPSALFEGEDGQFHASSKSAEPPSDPRDVVCLPPESKASLPGNARQSVYGIGAILYELITLESVGQGMRRPSEVAPATPPALEAILTKALVGDPDHRPDDLNALAQAFYQIQPQHSVAPPPADVGHLDHDDGFDVDVSMSLLPPAPSGGGQQVIRGMAMDAPLPPGVGGAVQAAPAAAAKPNEKESLVATKARLEADPRPRYVVVRQGMDHGPFTAVELLQQIASHTFEEDDIVRDSIDKTDLSIKESADFAPFARHARMGRQEKAEKAALEASVAKESRSTMGKTAFGLIAVAALLIIGGVAYMQTRGTKNDEIAVIEETAANVESDQGLKVAKHSQRSGGGVMGTKGGFPQLAGGMSCEAAQSAYVQEMKMGEKQKADLTVGQLGAVLNTGSYLNACGVPSSMSVSVCAAIQNGRAVGVTVTTTPRSGGIAGCVSRQIRGLRFPSNPKLDITRTTFAAN